MPRYFIRVALLLVYVSLLAMWLSACSSKPEQVCEENITSDQLHSSLMQEFSSVTAKEAAKETTEDRNGRKCGPVPCVSIRDDFLPLEPAIVGMYFKSHQMTIVGSESHAERVFSCSAKLSIELANKAIVPHSVKWQVTLFEPHPVLGTLTHDTDPATVSFLRNLTLGENALNTSARELAVWVKNGLAKGYPYAFNPNRFKTHLKSFEKDTGVDFYQRLVDGFEAEQ